MSLLKQVAVEAYSALLQRDCSGIGPRPPSLSCTAFSVTHLDLYVPCTVLQCDAAVVVGL